MDKQLFTVLIDRYLDGTASPEEKLLVESYYEQLAGEKAELPAGQMLALKEAIYKNVEDTIHPPARVVAMHRNWWKAASAAAMMVLLAGIIWLTLFQRNKTPHPAIAAKDSYNNDINPAKGGATLITGDGTKIYLDSTANGKLAAAGNPDITKTGEQLIYKPAAEPSYNTLTTDKGKSYQLTLADGTQVWLDAMSSIRYPTSFTGAERVVEVAGQAYFEVAHNARQPFRVKVNEKTIEVLGTHFNVNAFDPAMRTTLLEGSVRVTGNGQSVVIVPGEQAVTAGQFSIDHSPDIDEVMAWKNGRFKFTGSSIEDIFNQLSRWYDIDVVYEDRINEVFVANISKDVPISKVLALFEMTKQVKFKIDGKKVIVMK